MSPATATIPIDPGAAARSLCQVFPIGGRADRATRAPAPLQATTGWSVRAIPRPVRPRDVRWDATWKAAAVGAVAALPFGGPVLGIVASAAEAGLLAGIEARALSKLGGVDVSCTPGERRDGSIPRGDLRWLMLRAGAQKALVAIAEYGARRAVRATLKEIGIALPRLAGRAVFGAAAPFVSVAWSAAWNGIDMHRRLTPTVLASEALEAARSVTPADVEDPRVIAPLAWGSLAMAAA